MQGEDPAQERGNPGCALDAEGESDRARSWRPGELQDQGVANALDARRVASQWIADPEVAVAGGEQTRDLLTLPGGGSRRGNRRREDVETARGGRHDPGSPRPVHDEETGLVHMLDLLLLVGEAQAIVSVHRGEVVEPRPIRPPRGLEDRAAKGLGLEHVAAAIKAFDEGTGRTALTAEVVQGAERVGNGDDEDHIDDGAKDKASDLARARRHLDARHLLQRDWGAIHDEARAEGKLALARQSGELYAGQRAAPLGRETHYVRVAPLLDRGRVAQANG